MIYNIFKYLSLQFPNNTIFVNEKTILAGTTQIPDTYILLLETGGTDKALFSNSTFQILVGDINNYNCRKLAYSIYNYITNNNNKRAGRFGQILPAYTNHAGETFPAIQVAQMSPIAKPQSLGKDENHSLYTMNIQMYI